MIAQIVRRCRAIRGVDSISIACPEKDAPEISFAAGMEPIPGPERDLVKRLLNVAEQMEADKLVRVTGDCPLIPPDLIEHGIAVALGKGDDFPLVMNWNPRKFPDGFDFEIWDVPFLRVLDVTLSGSNREWFALWAKKNKVNCHNIEYERNLSKWRLTVDYPEDLDLVRAIYKDQGKDIWGMDMIIDWCRLNPAKMASNQQYVRDYGEGGK